MLIPLYLLSTVNTQNNEENGIVFVFLILIAVFITVALVRHFSDKKKEEGHKNILTGTNPASQTVPAIAGLSGKNDNAEIIAVISAAIAAIGESEGKVYRLKSIKKSENPLRKSWANAGISESMRPFSR